MNVAYRMQKFQDWITQQWVISFGRRVNPSQNLWLMGPFGEINGIGEKFIEQLTERENLEIVKDFESAGLLDSINNLNLSVHEISSLSKNVIDFYENTSAYRLKFKVKWNPFFKVFGYSVNRLFSQRINQLNIPVNRIHKSEDLTSEIIKLVCRETGELKYTLWLRKFRLTGKIIYSGIYSTCKVPSGNTCVKAVFPLPKGNATVILKPSVGDSGELILNSSGERFGDAGFYFLLNDSKGNFWSKYIPPFTDKLTVTENKGKLRAVQTLKLWNITVSTFEYDLEKYHYGR